MKRILLLLLIFCTNHIKADCMMDCEDLDLPLTKDSRIKTYIYNKNEVFLLSLHHGFSSTIELSSNETIETITLGDSYAWKITPVNNRIFIKPLETNIRTNMTIITDRREYHFDIIAEEFKKDKKQELVYVVRFYYPKYKKTR